MTTVTDGYCRNFRGLVFLARGGLAGIGLVFRYFPHDSASGSSEHTPFGDLGAVLIVAVEFVDPFGLNLLLLWLFSLD